MTEVDPREFYARPDEVQRPPEQDPPLTIRVISREMRDQPGVARAIKADRPAGFRWLLVSGSYDGVGPGHWLTHDDVRAWYIDHGTINIATAYRWHTDYPPDRQDAPQAAERGDMDVSAFRTME